MSSAPSNDLPPAPGVTPATAPMTSPAHTNGHAPAPAASHGRSHVVTVLLGAMAAAALVSTGMLWQKLSAIQEQLARQSADSGALAVEARAMA